MLEFINPTFVLFFVTVTIFCALGVMMVRGYEADEKDLLEEMARLINQLAFAEKDIHRMTQQAINQLNLLTRRDAVASDLRKEIMDLERELRVANAIIDANTRMLSRSFAVDADPYDHETQGL